MDGNNKISIKILELCYWKVFVDRGAPNKWVNKKMESLNLVIKEQINNSAVDMVSFLEAVKERVYDQQVEKLVKKNLWKGRILLDYQVDPVR